ncbi:DUF6257 family protein [Streptomyces sp. NPDC051909]|uniref:DUF6257 family protein n=1 Tax=Streptomyces sp. NPDC051909 TaxID=3154944 RepID=UPI00343E2FB5
MASNKKTSEQDFPKLTAGETARLGWTVARMAKRCLAGENADRSDLERKFERIVDGARDRAEKNAKKDRK